VDWEKKKKLIVSYLYVSGMHFVFSNRKDFAEGYILVISGNYMDAGEKIFDILKKLIGHIIHLDAFAMLAG